ncbi:MAG: sel1 repeat family protein, partial [Lachnospiraceae bacterium]|nr:sel1 repeat family protein [Lachnospiraceae bacterium]
MNTEDYIKACSSLEDVINKGISLLQDNESLSEALKLFKYADAKGNSDGSYWLGVAFQEQKSFEEALMYYNKAAQNGNSRAENRIALMYARGLGVQKDVSQAFMWLERAAKHHSLQGICNLAGMYWYGCGIEINKELALGLWRFAAQNDVQKAVQMLEIVNENVDGP